MFIDIHAHAYRIPFMQLDGVPPWPRPEDLLPYYDRIGVEKGSVLYRLYGQDSLTVNSFHHQAVKAVAPGIRVTAYADNGIVEAYEYGDRLIAFQFHPEALARSDDAWLAPFRYFVKMAGGK